MKTYLTLNRIIASILAGALFLSTESSYALRESQEDPGTLQAISTELQKSSGLEERDKKNGEASARGRAGRVALQLRRAVARYRDPTKAFRKQIHPGGILFLHGADVTRLTNGRVKQVQISRNDPFRNLVNQNHAAAFSRNSKDPDVRKLQEKGIRGIRVGPYAQAYHPGGVSQEILGSIERQLKKLASSPPGEQGLKVSLANIDLSWADVSALAGGEPGHEVLERSPALVAALEGALNRELQRSGGDLQRTFGVKAVRIWKAHRSLWKKLLKGLRRELLAGSRGGQAADSPDNGRVHPRHLETDFATAAGAIVHGLATRPRLGSGLRKQRQIVDQISPDRFGKPIVGLLSRRQAAQASAGAIRYSTLGHNPIIEQAINAVLRCAFTGHYDPEDSEGSPNARRRLQKAIGRVMAAKPASKSAAAEPNLVRLWQEAQQLKKGPLKLGLVMIGVQPREVNFEEWVRRVNSEGFGNLNAPDEDFYQEVVGEDGEVDRTWQPPTRIGTMFGKWYSFEVVAERVMVGDLLADKPMTDEEETPRGKVEAIVRNKEGYPTEFRLSLNGSTLEVSRSDDGWSFPARPPMVLIPDERIETEEAERVQALGSEAIRKDAVWQKVPLERVGKTLREVFGDWAHELEEAGATAIVLFERKRMVRRNKKDYQALFRAMPDAILKRIFLLEARYLRESNSGQESHWGFLTDGDPRLSQRVLSYGSLEGIAQSIAGLTPRPKAVSVAEAIPEDFFMEEDVRRFSWQLAQRLKPERILVGSIRYVDEMQAFLRELMDALGASQNSIQEGVDKVTEAMLELSEQPVSSGLEESYRDKALDSGA